MKDIIETVLMNTVVPLLQFAPTAEASLVVAIVFGISAVVLLISIIKG